MDNIFRRAHGRNTEIKRDLRITWLPSWRRPLFFVALLVAFTGYSRAEVGKLFVSPDGQGTACTSHRPCSLTTAQARIRKLAANLQSDLIVELQAGHYRIQSPLVFGAHDSGRAGHAIRWQGPEKRQAVLDGGKRVRDWSLVDPKRNLWIAALPNGGYGLQLFVDGRLAVRARAQGCKSPTECRYTTEGLRGGGSALKDLKHPEEVVAVLGVRWRDFHCGVQRLDGDDIVMRQPCWGNTIADSVKNGWSNASPKGKPFKGIDWFENAFEFLGTPGQFYIDPRKRVIYYVPRAGEDMRSADVELPTLEHLLLVSGTPDEPVHDLEFRNISFQHAAWTYAEQSDGCVPLQAGYYLRGTRSTLPDNGEGLTRVPAAVEVTGGQRIVFRSDSFSSLGAAGIALAGGTRDSQIKGASFEDLSGGAIFVGDTVAAPQRMVERTVNIQISRNTIQDVAREYRDNVAIMGAFNDSLTIDHNTIRDLPYTGISVGWGWNYEGEGDVQRDIHIRSNRISRFMLTLHDGGAIYTQAQSPGSDVTENYIDFSGTPDGNGIYLDERSRKYKVCGNVVWNLPKNIQEAHWLSAWASWSRDLDIENNWSDDLRQQLHNPGPTKRFVNNHLALTFLPATAKAVIAASGAEGMDRPVNGCAHSSADSR